MRTLRSSDCRKGRENGRARWLSARKSHAMIFMRDRCSNFPGCPTEPASSGIRETEVSRWCHQKIPDWRKMILLSAIILSIMSLLISMLGNMEMMNRLLTQLVRRTASSWSIIWKIEIPTRWVSHISQRYKRTARR